jgi:hypothetical protein
MSILSRSLIAATALVIATSAAVAASGDLVGGGGTGPAKVEQVKLALNGLNSDKCPIKVALIARVVADKPGNFEIRYRKAGGGMSDYVKISTQKTATGLYVAKHVQPFTIEGPTNTKYMVEVKGQPKISPWLTVKTNCVIDPKLELGG